MSAQLALDLDHDAIRLLSRQSDGWVVEGVAELTAEDITDRINKLRQRADDLAGPDPSVMLVLPRSQVLYTRFEDTDPDDVGAQLEGLTPYDLADITWDTVQSGRDIHVAAVAHETLDEAVAFATASKFQIVGLTSEPPEGLFPRLPVFAQRSETAVTPMVLEPAAPPPRKDVAFSSQRTRSYGPRGVRPPGRLHLDPATPSRAPSLPSQAMAAMAQVPVAARAALGAAVLVGLGVLLWPASDPDPLAQRDFTPDFADIAVANDVAPPAPPPDGAPNIDALEAVTLLRDPPVIAVPVIIGSSEIDLDAIAGVAPEQVFAAVAAKPLSAGGDVTLAAAIDRPQLPALPALLTPDALLSGGVARVEIPEALTPSPTEVTQALVPVARAPAPLASIELTALPDISLPAPPRIVVEPLGEPVEAPVLLAALPAAPDTDELDTTAPGTETPIDTALVARLPEDGLTDPVPNAAMALPAPASGENFALAEDGFVEATPDGALSPDGILVFAGQPALVAPPRPVAPPPEVNVGDPALASIQPRPRPAVTRVERDPVSLASTVVLDDDTGPALVPAPDVPEDLIREALAAEPEPEPETEVQDNRTILTASLVPRPRPARPAPPSASTEPTQASATRAAVPQPRIPSSANVAREATIENGLRFQRINLIGVYGAASDRRALVRLPTGKFIKLQVGDRLDGGRVAQIGPDSLVYQKGGRSLSLAMPNT